MGVQGPLNISDVGSAAISDTVCGLRKGCMSKKDCCNDHKIYGKLPVNETVETPITSTCLSVDYLELKSDCMPSKPLHNEQATI
jgi:hypothetical protein